MFIYERIMSFIGSIYLNGRLLYNMWFLAKNSHENERNERPFKEIQIAIDMEI